MPIFKYTVANKQGKKLSGSIETPDESTARNELNSLGFSILELTEKSDENLPATSATTATPTPETGESHQKFVFESINPQGQVITGTITGVDDISAFKRLTEEYDLTVTSIWPENSTDDQKRNAKARGTYHLQEILNAENENEKIEETKTSQEHRKNEIFTKTKIEEVMRQVNELLAEYENDISPGQKHEIDKRIDKLLRIKNSTNLEYVVTTAEDLLTFIQKQEMDLKKEGYLDKRAKLKMKIKSMLSRLHESGKPKTLSEDIVENIQKWQQKHVKTAASLPWYTRLTNKILTKIQQTFKTPEEITIIKNQIKTYNSQIWEYIKIYFKEPTKEYKAHATSAIKTIWRTRKKALQTLKETKARLKQAGKENRANPKTETPLSEGLLTEITEFTGWLLAFYLVYYFVSLYVTSKNFGFGDPTDFPKSLDFYNTQIFKYVLAVVFLLHTAFTLKTNFFKKTALASIIIFPLTTFAIIFVLVNF